MRNRIIRIVKNKRYGTPDSYSNGDKIYYLKLRDDGFMVEKHREFIRALKDASKNDYDIVVASVPKNKYNQVVAAIGSVLQ